MKILILIMSHKTKDESFTNFKRIWDNQISNIDTSKLNIEFKFLYSDNEISENYQIQGNNLITKCVEDYWYALLLKVIAGLEYFTQNNFDLVFKTNLSTIMNFDKFYEYCEEISKDREYVYDGLVGHYKDYYFCSGAGILLNTKSVNLILDNKNLLNETWTDDIFIGFVLNKLNGIKPNYGGINRFDIVTENFFFTKEDIRNNTHIRIKVRTNDFDVVYSNLVYKYLTDE
jgi:hypothetical protein